MPRITFTNVVGQDVAVGNADGYGKSFTIPPAGLVVDMTGGQLSSSEPQLTALQGKGYVTWTIAQDPNVADELELMSSVPQAIMLAAVTPAAKSTTAVHAAVAGNAGANLFPGPITNPVTPRNLSATAAAAYDGGSLTVVGTDQFDRAQTEVIAAAAASTVLGTKVFKTVTSVTKAAVGSDPAAVSVGTGDKIGVTLNIAAGSPGIVFVDGVAEAATVDATLDAWTPTTAPNGAKVFIALVNVQAG